MSDAVIRVRGLGKAFHLEQLRDRHDTLRDALSAGMRRLLRAGGERQGVRGRRGADVHWALRDVSFDVSRGEVLGIVGPNGAGKSTLLKILTRITEPTVGEAEIHGRLGALLEVGTGFHPELTGRENIWLNGAILGMRRGEIDRKFDEIVAFAEVDRFIDTPVKRYSSGMYLRLAFSVAAHLEPDILIVDEVLAVGDAKFQRKCLGKMGEVARGGRTVLFVSHHMNAVQRLCTRCVLLQQGQIADIGPTTEVVGRYLAGAGTISAAGEWIDTTEVARRGDDQVRVEAVQFGSDRADLVWQAYPGGPLEVALMLTAAAPRPVPSVAVTLYDQHGTKLINADTVTLGRDLVIGPGTSVVRFRIDELPLNPGVYWLGFWVSGPGYLLHDFAETALQVEVVDIQEEGFGRRPESDGLVRCRFRVEEEPVARERTLTTASLPGSPEAQG